MKIKFFAVGGTIDKVYFDRKSIYQVGEPRLGEILTQANVNLEYEYVIAKSICPLKCRAKMSPFYGKRL